MPLLDVAGQLRIETRLHFIERLTVDSVLIDSGAPSHEKYVKCESSNQIHSVITFMAFAVLRYCCNYV